MPFSGSWSGTGQATVANIAGSARNSPLLFFKSNQGNPLARIGAGAKQGFRLVPSFTQGCVAG